MNLFRPFARRHRSFSANRETRRLLTAVAAASSGICSFSTPLPLHPTPGSTCAFPRPFLSPSARASTMADDHDGAPPPVRVSISSAFDSGNIRYGSVGRDPDAAAVVRLSIVPDPHTELEDTSHMQSFAFRSVVSAACDDDDNAPRTVRYVVTNAGNASYPSAWPGSTVFFSARYDPHDPDGDGDWVRIPDTSYDAAAGTLSWSHVHGPRGSSVHFAYFPPYTYDRHLAFSGRCGTLPAARTRSLGRTLDGRDIDCVSCGTGPQQAWVIARQHPGESMAEFYAEGLLERLLAPAPGDAAAERALREFTWHVVPNMNVDGSTRGHLRTNAAGSNLNREWDSSGDYEAPTLERSPEVYHILRDMDRTGVDFFADVHGDEELPFNFLAGSEGCDNWGDRLRSLHGAFHAEYCRSNSDMQQKVGYEPDEPGEGKTCICSNQIAIRFDCLAFTLEMPFKDCMSNPDSERGWSPLRSKRLGASLIDPVLYVQPHLRSKEAFWNTLPIEDAYVRPSSKY
mmetsp:Transcript_40231/g.78648  ORF Transcript_40231/g.78648 Transcript_40231/m.78648 type:complete len:512 (+) Transcript_40231:60-1595(+)